MDEPVPVLEPVLPRRARPSGRGAAIVAVAALGLLSAWLVGLEIANGPPPPRLAIVEDDGGLATIDATGGSVRRFDAPGIHFMFPAWSPDGSRIAAVGTDRSYGSVFVIDAVPVSQDAPAMRRIYTGVDRPPFYVFWSPDGEAVAFLTSDPEGIALRIAPADSDGGATLVRRAAPMYWDFVEPDRLIVHAGGGPDGFVGEVDAAGAAVDASAVGSGTFRAPVIGADGRYRAYVRPAAGADDAIAQEVVVEARDGSARHVAGVFGSVAIGFDPAGTSLAFVAATDAARPASTLPMGPLRTLDPVSGAVRTLVDGRVLAFFWSPDGRTILSVELPAEGGGTTEARGPASGAATIGSLSDLALAADEPGVRLHVRFVEVATGAVRSERDVRLSELFAFQVLPFFDQYALSHRVWSPDSTGVVLPIDDVTGSVGIVVFPADGSEPRSIAQGRIAFWSP